MKFTQLGLRSELLDAVSERGYTDTTPIQEKAIPSILEGRDVLGGAQTGTGKTAAFALPILQLLSTQNKKTKNPRALVLTPTRELADQVCTSFGDYGKKVRLKNIAIFGGVNINPQIKALRQGVDIVVATPGRLLDHLQQRTISLASIEILVMDEADRMLDMGFIRDIKKILKVLPPKRQNLMFSATYEKDIRDLAENFLVNPVSVEVAKRNTAAALVDQKMHYIDKNQKRYLLSHLIKDENWYQVLVFCRTKHGANRLAKQLDKDGISSAAIHGDKSQNARTRALNNFKDGNLQALIATDVAARGLHLEQLGHVVNYDLPQIPEDYVHRIGRTGRAGQSGIAISFVSPDEEKQMHRIQKILEKPVKPFKAAGFKPVALSDMPPREDRPQRPHSNSSSRTYGSRSSAPASAGSGRFSRNFSRNDGNSSNTGNNNRRNYRPAG